MLSPSIYVTVDCIYWCILPLLCLHKNGAIPQCLTLYNNAI